MALPGTLRVQHVELNQTLQQCGRGLVFVRRLRVGSDSAEHPGDRLDVPFAVREQLAAGEVEERAGEPLVSVEVGVRQARGDQAADACGRLDEQHSFAIVGRGEGDWREGISGVKDTLARAGKVLDGMKLAGDQQIGVSIIRRAIEEPMRHIATNAGHEGSIVVQKVRDMGPEEGFNALTDAYENLVSHTDPENGDTDGDGVGDAIEVLQGRNPRVAGSVSDTGGTLRFQVRTPLRK